MQEQSCCAIAVMAKAPEAGRSKTRLCPPVQPNHAAWLSEGFLRDMYQNIGQAARHAPIAGYAAYAPAGTEAAMQALLPPDMGLVLADGTPRMPPDVQGFDRCLLHAVQALFALGHPAACASLLQLMLEIRAGVPDAFSAPATQSALRRLGLFALPAAAESVCRGRTH